MAVAAFSFDRQAPAVHAIAYVHPEPGVPVYDVEPAELDARLNRGLISWWGRVVHTAATRQGNRDGYGLAVMAYPVKVTVRQASTNNGLWEPTRPYYTQVPVRLPDVYVPPVIEEVVGAATVFAAQVSRFAAEHALARGADIASFRDTLAGIGKTLLINA